MSPLHIQSSGFIVLTISLVQFFVNSLRRLSLFTLKYLLPLVFFTDKIEILGIMYIGGGKLSSNIFCFLKELK